MRNSYALTRISRHAKSYATRRRSYSRLATNHVACFENAILFFFRTDLHLVWSGLIR